MAKTIDLPIAVTYVKNWGTTEAVRELFQNALDSTGEMAWELNDNTLKLTSRGVVIPRASLLMGYSDKPIDSIGQFGEGYKLACLVLLREGKRVAIKNGRELWRPRLKKSRKFGAEILSVDITDEALDNRDLTFIVTGLTEVEREAIIASNLHLSNTMEYGVLQDRPGEVFVKGLFVCKDKELKHGYNFKPCEITLDRDRRMVRSFELQWATSKLWVKESETKPEAFLDMVESQAPDVAHIDYHAVNTTAKLVADSFTAKHGAEAIPVSNQWDADQFQGRKIVIVPKTQRDMITRIRPNPVIKIKKPKEFLEDYLERFEDQMSEEEIEAFNELIEISQDWRA